MPNSMLVRIKKRAPLMLVAITAFGIFMVLQAQESGQTVNKTTPALEAEIAPETRVIESAAEPDSFGQHEFYGDRVPADSPNPVNAPEQRVYRYPVVRQAVPVAYPGANPAGTSFSTGTEGIPSSGRMPGGQYPGYASASDTVTSPGSRADRLPSSAAGAVDEASGFHEPTPEEINPFLPNGAVAEEPANRQVKIECPTFITGAMKTRYSYETLEAMGCEPGFDY